MERRLSKPTCWEFWFSDNEWDSDIYDDMDDDDLLQIDEAEEGEINEDVDTLLTDDEFLSDTNKSEKRLICKGLQSEQISNYIKRTLAQFGSSQRSTWQIDQNSCAVHAKTCSGFAENENVKFTPKFYWENSPLKSHLQNFDLREIWNSLNNDNENKNNQTPNSWIILADKAINGAFKDTPVFSGLCKVMSEAAERKAKNKSKQNMKYSEEFTSFLILLGNISSRALDLFRQNLEGRGIQSLRKLRRNSEDYLTDPDLCFENVARFKQLLDTIRYDGLIAAMTDNTKLKSQLKYSSTFGCIIGSIFSKEETYVNVYSDIPKIIKSSNGIAKVVRVYLLQIPLPKFPLVAIALIPNKGSDTVNDIEKLHRKLIEEIALQLHLHILSLVREPSLNINFSCPILDEVGPIIRVQDPKHAKKTARNAIMSGAYRQDDGELIDSYLNRDIAPIEPNQSFTIFTSLAESIVLLVKVHYEFYPQIPLLSWFHSSKPCEHFFGIARQINADFDFAELIQMVPKIAQYNNAL
ncbi:hypothetical protein RhiirA5_417479 [Rhizophagus irregularis]|uniref:Uncharacterized protein n=1 Tax=Rhizophagus irregularis TaxID=588596 RepID=A0A2N0PMK0_9GLOM|nr:hypothetical protein RhiirA5_417479 [Rhizophagus irregularis]